MIKIPNAHDWLVYDYMESSQRCTLSLDMTFNAGGPLQ